MIRNVIFDIGKVLIGFDWRGYLDRLFDTETASHISQALFGTGYWGRLDEALMTEDEILELFFSADPDYKDEIRTAYDRIGECVERRDWAVPLADDLRERGYNVYFLSNMSEHVIGSNPEAFEFTSHMDGGIYSCHVHEVKPGKTIFRLLIDKYSLQPEECLFIDDHAENTAAARSLGMKAITFCSHEQLIADLDRTLTKDSGHDRITVLCYGDSNTYGYHPLTFSRYPYDQRWTSILGELLGDRYEVIPEGLSGRTTAYDRPGAEWKNGAASFISCLGTHKPVDILIIMLGTNDCNAELELSAEDIAGGMETLVTHAEKYAPELQGYIPEIIVTAPAAIRDGYEKSPFACNLTPESVAKSRDIGKLYREIASRHMCLYADATGAAEVSSYDCEHLTEKGHRQLAELLRDTIESAMHGGDMDFTVEIRP